MVAWDRETRAHDWKKEQVDLAWECPEQIGGKGHWDQVTFLIVLFFVNLEEFVLRLIRAPAWTPRRIECLEKRGEGKEKKERTRSCHHIVRIFNQLLRTREFVRELAPTVMNYAWYAFALIKPILGSDR